MAITSDNILGQYEASLNQQAGTDRIATDKDTFLKLLVAQLTHQDPLNPVEDTDFIAQLAQFTTVEELQNINKGVESINEAYLKQQATNAAELIGMDVSAAGDRVTISNIGSEDENNPPRSSYIFATYPYETAGGKFTVQIMNDDGSSGRMVYSETLPPQTADTHRYQWPGRDDRGNPMPDGTYIITISAVDETGANMYVQTTSVGTVIGVKTMEDGNHLLYLEDNRSVYFNDVDRISLPGGLTGNYQSTEDPDADGTDTGNSTQTG
ncbi:flagellar hook assembly protein FlgD [Desulfovibrio sp. OttesenSCG-928-A18]|nr:flagellar hook assembly protein FlgD [Desulfovibrio sp. OttesenSCG-928-A18]